MFDVSIRDFTKAASIVACAVDRRTTIPILSAMKVQANGRLVLEGTNLDMVVTAAIDCDTKSDVELLIDDPRAVMSAIGAAGGALATFEAAPDGFRTRAGRLNRTVKHGLKPVDWPSSSCSVDVQAFGATFTAAVIQQIERIMVAISTEETRYYLNGVYLHHLEGWTYTLVATDGHRLMAGNIQLPDATGELPPLIIPAAFIRSIVKHFRKTDKPITFQVGTPRLSNVPEGTLAPDHMKVPRVALAGTVGGGTFSADVTFQGKTIDGTYPDYRRVVPAAPKHQAIFQVAELRRAVLAVAAGYREPPAVSLSFGPDGVDVGMSRGVDGVTAVYRVEAAHNMPDGLSVGFRSTYLLDVLAAFSSAEVSFATDDQSSPALFTDVTDGDFFAVQMPMRI